MNGYNVTVYEPKDMRNHPVWKLLGGRTIAFRKVHVDLTGSVTAALMLAQALYWSEHTKDKAGWFYKSATEWTEETGLSVQEQRTARNKLNQFDWWQEEKRMTNGSMTYWFRVNPDKFIQHAIQQLESSNMQNQQLVDDTNMQNQQLGGGATVGSNSSITLDVFTQDEQHHQNGVGGVQEDCSDDVPYTLQEVYRFYESNFSLLTPFLSESIAHAYDDFPSDWIVEAMQIALTNSRRKWSYVEGILKRWHADGKQDTRKQESAQPKLQAVLLEA